MDPYAKDAMKVFTRHKFEPCTEQSPLTSIKSNFSDDLMELIIHDEHKNDYLSWWQNDIKVWDNI